MNPVGFFRAHSWNGCTLTYSSLHEIADSALQPAGSAGIKYVIEGTEHYGMRGLNHYVRPGQYLFLNENRPFDVELPYKPEAVRGFCITLSAGLINDIEQCSTRTEDQLLDRPGDIVPFTDFPELTYPAGDTLSMLLGELSTRLDTHTGRVAQHDELLFTHIAGALLLSQRKLRKITAPLSAQRTVTRIELYRRIMHAKTIMDDAPETVSTIAALAQEATLSEYHFMRCFRQLFGISPHQYLIRSRIRKAAALLTTHLPVSEVALRCGFSDLAAFSKTFRKHYGCAPSQFRSCI